MRLIDLIKSGIGRVIEGAAGRANLLLKKQIACDWPIHMIHGLPHQVLIFSLCAFDLGNRSALRVAKGNVLAGGDQRFVSAVHILAITIPWIARRRGMDQGGVESIGVRARQTRLDLCRRNDRWRAVSPYSLDTALYAV